ncbi:trichohyalin-like [Macrobrachium rosenbergii]|uniref:trichohyalin-like n=1 Tax=Macrobrachium rosenbergii TaxID=79674 RepID=UPI0034D74D94
MNCFIVKCDQIVNSVLARVPHVGSVDLSIISKVLQPGFVASVPYRNWFAGILGAIGGNYCYNFYQEKAARKCAEDKNLTILAEMDDLRDICDIWKTIAEQEQQKNFYLRKEMDDRTKAEDALKQRVCRLEKDLADGKVRDLEDLLDLEEAANKRIQMAEQKLHELESENIALQRSLNENEDLKVRQQQELAHLNGLEKSHKKLREKFEEACMEIGRREATEAALRRTIGGLEEELSRKEATYIQTLKDFDEEARKKMEKDRTHIEELASANEALNESIVRKQKEIDELNSLATKQKLESNKDRLDIQEMEKRMNSLENERSSLQELLIEQQSQNNKEIRKLEEEVLAHLNEKKALMERLDKQEKERDEDMKRLKEEILLLTEEKSSENERAQKLESSNEELKNEQANFARAKQNLLRRLDAQIEIAKDLEKRVRQDKEEKDRLKTEIERANQKTLGLVEEMNEKEAACQKEIGDLEVELRHTQDMMNLAGEEKEMLNKAIEQKEKEIAQHRRQIENLESEKELAAKENEEKRNELQDVNDLLSKKLQEASLRNQDLERTNGDLERRRGPE